MTRPVAAGLLLLRFLRALLVSGLHTAALILRTRPGQVATDSGFVRLGFAPMSAQGAALLGALVTLTPGSTTLDIDMERRELLLHLLDARQADAVVAGLRHDFESLLVVLFGTGTGTGAGPGNGNDPGPGSGSSSGPGPGGVS